MEVDGLLIGVERRYYCQEVVANTYFGCSFRDKSCE